MSLSQKRWVFLLVLIGLLGWYLQQQSQAPQGLLLQLQARIEHKLTGTGILHRLFLDEDMVYSSTFLPEIYRPRRYLPLWFNAQGVLPQAGELILALAKAEIEGLNPEDYHLRKIERLYRSALQKNEANTVLEQQQLADLDLLLTDAFLLYGSHLLNGRVNPETIDPNWEIKPTEVDLLQVLNEALGVTGIAATLQNLLPRDPGYSRLKQVLADYQNYVSRGIVYAPSDNVKVSERIWQMKANLERWRWLPQDFGPRFVLVNIANFELYVVENENTIMQMKVIVGKDYRETPVFAAQMSEVVFNPHWNIPQKLALRDIFPIARQNPEYLKMKGIRVFKNWDENAPEIDPIELPWRELNENNFTYHLRQDPGPQNSLGRILFLMPNPYAVYLHDTPEKYLFAQEVRTYSSGCIRLQKPYQLAAYLLQNRGWDLSGVVNAVQGDQNQHLSVSIPIYILYWTAWVDPKGKPYLIEDIYNHDPALIAALKAQPPR